MNVITSVKLQKLFTNPVFASQLKRIVMGTSNIVVAEYKKEAPVDKGLLRNSVITSISNQDGYSVTTVAQSSGKPYPIYVHEGTGAFRGVDKDYGSKGQGLVRSGRTNKGAGGIQPNKFARRAKDIAEPKVFRYITREVKTII